MVDVTSQNFFDELLNIDSELSEASFTCLDFEFSGLHSHKSTPISLFDSPQERYSSLRNSVKNFTVLQCGLSIFRYDVASRIYNSKTYNIWIFPRASNLISRQTQFESAACEFLSKYDFDFNKCFYGGVPYLNEKEINDLKSKHAEELNANDIVLNDVKRNFKHRKLEMLKKWTAEGRPGEVLEIDCLSRGMALILLSEIHDQFNDLIAEKPRAEASLLVIRKATLEEKLEYIELKHETYSREIEKVIGFTHVVRLLKKHKKPIIGHNILMDLLFMYEKFHKPLPESFEDFKHLFHEQFPVIFDTRHITSNIKVELKSDVKYKDLIRGTTLLSLFEECNKNSIKGLLYQPKIKDNLGEAYGMREHNAGYDSCLVGQVFIRLAHFYCLWKNSSPNVKPFHFRDYIREFSNFKNCLNLIRSALSHISLTEPDPENKRPQWLIVASKCNSKINMDHVKHVLSAFGDVNTRKIDDYSCLVALPSIGMAAGLLVEMEDHEKYNVQRYEGENGSVTKILIVSVVGISVVFLSALLLRRTL